MVGIGSVEILLACGLVFLVGLATLWWLVRQRTPPA
jgi:hypothetical protein